MSLKAFHILFVLASIAMSAVVGFWGIGDYRQTGDTTNLAIGVGVLCFGVLLVGYSFWFVHKIRTMKLL